MQVAVAAAFAGASASAYRGVPSGLGLLFSVLAGVLAGPLAGVLVALAGGVGFVVFVTNGQLGGWVAVVLWIVAAGIAGAVADRYREAGHDRDIAHASERRARHAAESESTRLAHLHALTGRLADAVTVADVCGALVDTAIGSLGAAASRVALLSTDGTRLETVAARGYPDEVRERWSSFPANTKDILGDSIGQRSVVTVASADEALERYPMLAGLGAGYPVGAQAAAPLLTGDELLGVLGRELPLDATLLGGRRVAPARDRAPVRAGDRARTTVRSRTPGAGARDQAPRARLGARGRGVTERGRQHRGPDGRVDPR